jgi:hypothetical protein
MHKKRKRRSREEMLALYQKSKKVPVAWQLYAKGRVDNEWHPLGQQHKYRKDAELDKKNVFIGMNPGSRAVFKKFKVIQTPATGNELTQRRLLRTLEKHPGVRGFMENFVGVGEFKIYGERIGPLLALL